MKLFSLFIFASLLHPFVCPPRPLCFWYMTDLGEDVEVPCGQASQVRRKEEVTCGALKGGGGEADRGMHGQKIGGQR